MKTVKELERTLTSLNGRGYKAYKEIRGTYDFNRFMLHIDYVQGDPFASPSRLRVVVPQRFAGFPPELFENRSRKIGLESFLASGLSREARRYSKRSGTGKSGLILADTPGQQVLERNSMNLDSVKVEARFKIGLPAAGRRILGREAVRLLTKDVPALVEKTLFYSACDKSDASVAVETNEDADALRRALPGLGLIAFIASGSILPRRSGVDDRPLDTGVVIPFSPPDSLCCEIRLPNCGTVTGMGIPKGVTLLVGGGFHGKSTLLNALEKGVYNHSPGDGRELVATTAGAVTVRAENGRSVSGVDISPFIGSLPYGGSTRDFSTPNASGSTSQAANIQEALEAGADLLLIDEDTAATNFMIRDYRMQRLVPENLEPITPFVDKVRQLYSERDVSTVLVVGGSGDYLEVADMIIAMESYVPFDVTEEAGRIVAETASKRKKEGGDSFGETSIRIPDPDSLSTRRGKRETDVKAFSTDSIRFGVETIDLSGVNQLVHENQAKAVADSLVLLRNEFLDGRRSIGEALSMLEEMIRRDGLDALGKHLAGDYAVFRRFELAAALNRLRTLRIRNRRSP